MVSVILLPAGPRILSMASLSGRPAMELPSMPAMRSPVLMPARLAGVPSIGEITLIRPPSSWVTSMPTPPNWPLVVICMSPYILASM